jgi:hypothetical protein
LRCGFEESEVLESGAMEEMGEEDEEIKTSTTRIPRTGWY